jgi:hypothetical protein
VLSGLVVRPDGRLPTADGLEMGISACCESDCVLTSTIATTQATTTLLRELDADVVSISPNESSFAHGSDGAEFHREGLRQCCSFRRPDASAAATNIHRLAIECRQAATEIHPDVIFRKHAISTVSKEFYDAHGCTLPGV